ncbi:hypothetical protein EOT10_15830 [Streptomyces antnestii]|uniref:Uncharacterized protein n=1 Tax=Streptomyces antnestii TaxID=2494256 RepID=A0A3S2VI79_9ACTN|nr:hypothetical protein [Streptomyces sp. San01]RVU24473.1 hypothetical protein EOT10_15830 [Streptomyces sp. San01]
MQTTPAPTPTSPAKPRLFTRGQLTATVMAVLLVALLGFTAKACESVEGGQVRSTAEFKERVKATQQAGEDTYTALAPAPLQEPYAHKEGSTSCVDDFGFDDAGVTRDQPIYTWGVEFDDRDGYLTALANLKADWKEQGRTVRDIAPQAGLPGISTTDAHGTQLTLAPDYYTNKPVIRAEGTCMRYHYA